MCIWSEGPSLHVGRGLCAKAAEYARKAIAESGKTPLTEAEWLSTTDGFNSFRNNSRFWGMKFEKENDAVQTGICNRTSMMSAEAAYGYAGILNLPYLGPGAAPTVANSGCTTASPTPTSASSRG